MHFAVRLSDPLVRLLADRGASIDVKDRQGRTPLDHAQGIGLRGRAGGPVEPRSRTVALVNQLLGQPAASSR
jgi:ankyrin repeat protein